MGCDIHAFIEYVYEGDTFTNTFSDGEIHFGRNYTLFSLLAGVRGMEQPVVSPRGFPDDCVARGDSSVFKSNWIVAEKYAEYGSDAHTPTWLTLDELKKVRSLFIKEQLEFNSVSDSATWKLANDRNVMNSIFTHTFGEHENSGLYLSIVILESLKKINPNIKSRLVCWFDS